MLLIVFIAVVVLLIVAMLARESEKRDAAITASLNRIQNSINGWLQTFDLESSVQTESPEEPALPNPTPSEVRDAFETAAVVSAFESRSPSDKVKYLQALSKSGYVPFDLAKRAVNDESEYVRLWLASHASLDYNGFEYIGSGEDRQLIQRKDREPNLFWVMREDSSHLVRAALYSNAHFEQDGRGHFNGHFPTELSLQSFQTWFVSLSLSELERQALMRNPNLNAYSTVELMRAQSTDLKLTQKEHVALVSAALRNSSLIRDSRDSWTALHQRKLFAEIWKLARTRWRDQEMVIRAVLSYIHTTQEVKLETYKEFNGADRAWVRNNILGGCTMTQDAAVITLGLLDPDEMCREEAAKRVGPHWQLLKNRRLRWRYWSRFRLWGAMLRG